MRDGEQDRLVDVDDSAGQPRADPDAGVHGSAPEIRPGEVGPPGPGAGQVRLPQVAVTQVGSG